MYTCAFVCLYASYIHEYQNNNCEIDFKKNLKEEYVYKKFKIPTDTYRYLFTNLLTLINYMCTLRWPPF